MVGRQGIIQTKSNFAPFFFSGHPIHPQGFNNSEVKEILGINSSVHCTAINKNVMLLLKIYHQWCAQTVDLNPLNTMRGAMDQIFDLF